LGTEKGKAQPHTCAFPWRKGWLGEKSPGWQRGIEASMDRKKKCKGRPLRTGAGNRRDARNKTADKNECSPSEESLPVGPPKKKGRAGILPYEEGGINLSRMRRNGFRRLKRRVAVDCGEKKSNTTRQQRLRRENTVSDS